MDELVKRLAFARRLEKVWKSQIEELETELHDTPIGLRLSLMREDFQSVTTEVEIATQAVRAAALKLYYANGEKKVHSAVGIRVYQVLDYDPAEALEYARKHLPHALKLDKRAFDKAAKAIPLNFVERSLEPRSVIARDLSKWLE